MCEWFIISDWKLLTHLLSLRACFQPHAFFLRQNALTFSFPIKSNPLFFSSSKCISLFLSPTKWYCLLVTDQLCLLTFFQPIMLVCFYLAIEALSLFFLYLHLLVTFQPNVAQGGGGSNWPCCCNPSAPTMVQQCNDHRSFISNHLCEHSGQGWKDTV